MAAIVAASKSYFIGPQDGWTLIVSGTTNFIRISGYPHTHPFQVAVASSTPALTVPGITVCHHPFKVYDFTASQGISGNFYIKVNNPANQTSTGKLRIDVYCEGGTLA